MEKSIVVHDENHEPMMVNEADMDFRIPGLVNVDREHRDGCAKLSETSERWTSLGTSHDERIMTGRKERRCEAKQWQDAARNFVNTD